TLNEFSFMQTIVNRDEILTVIDKADRFPETLDPQVSKYGSSIKTFQHLILESNSSAELLRKIRTQGRSASERMALLKMFRRCVSPVIDTEKSKKIRTVSTESLIAQ